MYLSPLLLEPLKCLWKYFIWKYNEKSTVYWGNFALLRYRNVLLLKQLIFRSFSWWWEVSHVLLKEGVLPKSWHKSKRKRHYGVNHYVPTKEIFEGFFNYKTHIIIKMNQDWRDFSKSLAILTVLLYSSASLAFLFLALSPIQPSTQDRFSKTNIWKYHPLVN